MKKVNRLFYGFTLVRIEGKGMAATFYLASPDSPSRSSADLVITVNLDAVRTKEQKELLALFREMPCLERR